MAVSHLIPRIALRVRVVHLSTTCSPLRPFAHLLLTSMLVNPLLVALRHDVVAVGEQALPRFRRCCHRPFASALLHWAGGRQSARGAARAGRVSLLRHRRQLALTEPARACRPLPALWALRHSVDGASSTRCFIAKPRPRLASCPPAADPLCEAGIFSGHLTYLGFSFCLCAKERKR